MRALPAALAALGVASAAHAAVRTQLPTGVVPVAYELEFRPDAQALTFSGAVKITLDVQRPTDQVTLNAVDLSIDGATLDGAAAAATLDAPAQTASFKADHALAPGRHVLSVAYHGVILQSPTGLFAVDYGQGAAARRMITTQFEPADARRLLPVLDEPAYKAIFQLTAVAPAGQMVVTNTPEASRQALPGGRVRIRFQPTPRMSSYLLFYGQGELERITTQVDGVTVGVVTRRGDGERGRYTLQSAAALLAYYDSYFGVKFPLPKLDLIAAPGQVGPAMENWGAILFPQQRLLIDPKLSTAADRQAVFGVVAHEMAHQWFGDLVTMAWWDDLWLNEGFASWMAAKAADHFNPSWGVLLDAQADKDEAMELDAKAGAHAIVQPVETVAQAEQAFDAITYQKGQTVLRMLEAYAGEDAWRSGVRAYMARHAYGSTVSDDLWAEVDRASGRDVSAVAHDFTLKSGVPLIRVAESPPAAPSAISLTPTRYALDETQKGLQSWRTPVISQAVGAAAPYPAMLVSVAGTHRLGAAAAGPVIVNAGQGGYFRTAYAPKTLAALTARFGEIAPADQIGLLNDAQALTLAGYAPADGALGLLSAAAAAQDPVVADRAVQLLLQLDALHDDGPGRTAYRAWARGRLQPVLARIGFDPRAGEPDSVGVLRELLLIALSRFDDPAVIAQGRERLEAYRRDRTSLPAGIRRAVLLVAAEHADPPVFGALQALAEGERDGFAREQLFRTLGQARDPVLARRALDLGFGPTGPTHDGPTVLAQQATVDPRTAWTYALSHLSTVMQEVPGFRRNTFMPMLAGRLTDLSAIAELDAYAAKNLPADARREVEKARSAIRYHAQAKARVIPQVDAWAARQADAAKANVGALR